MPVTATPTAVVLGGQNVRHASAGSQRKTVTDVATTGNYSTTRVPCTAADLGLSFVEDASVQIVTPPASAGAVNAVYDIANSRIQLNTAAAEVSTGDTLSTASGVLRVTAFGRL